MKKRNKLYFFNIISLSFVLLLFIVYLIQQNGITSKDFQVDLLASQLKQSQITYNNLIIQKSSLERVDEIQLYAFQKGMVEVGEIIYIYESGRVALKKI